MNRTGPYVRRRRIVAGLAVAVVSVATFAAWPSGAEETTSAPGTKTVARPAISKTPALSVEALRDQALKADVSRAEALRVESLKVSNAKSGVQVRLPPADHTVFVRRERLTGGLSPKSVVASPAGLVTAQNMMYSHTISVFNTDGMLRGTVNDSVDLSAFGIGGHPGISKGAPVEAAFTHDGKHVYVSNYSMYGKGFGPEGLDSCTPASAPDQSFLYRIDIARLKIDQVIPVGAVPKYVAITPDGSTVLVTNWCSWTMSLVNVKTGKLVATIPVGGAYPRGIAVTRDSKTAFIAVMGGNRIVKVNLASRTVAPFAYTGNGPRHIVISPDGRYLYVTNNSSGTVSKVNAANGQVLRTVSTGQQPRSMAISSDGLAVYVVNYESSTVSKLRTSDLGLIATAATDKHPIGIAYEPRTGSVWVACYSGSILVFDDSRRAQP
jgi:YVTN family beta-propeller protein